MTNKKQNLKVNGDFVLSIQDGKFQLTPLTKISDDCFIKAKKKHEEQ